MNLKDKIRALVSKFELLKNEEIELLVEKTIANTYKKGTVLLKEGQTSTKCYMVLEGCVREYLIKDGLQKSTAFYTEGESLTPIGKDGKPSKHYLVCEEDCILTISDKSFEEEIRGLLPRLDDVFQDIALAKINQAKEEWSEFVSSSPEERYLNLLEKKPSLLNRLPHHHIASYLGMKPQSLSRIRKRILAKRIS